MIDKLRGKLATDSLLRSVPFIDYGKRAMTDESCWVGHAMFGTLCELLGEQQFNRVVGGNCQRYADAGTTRQLAMFATRTASPDLTPFFSDWLFSTRWTGLIANGASMGELAEHYRSKAARGR